MLARAIKKHPESLAVKIDCTVIFSYKQRKDESIGDLGNRVLNTF